MKKIAFAVFVLLFILNLSILAIVYKNLDDSKRQITKHLATISQLKKENTELEKNNRDLKLASYSDPLQRDNFFRRSLDVCGVDEQFFATMSAVPKHKYNPQASCSYVYNYVPGSWSNDCKSYAYTVAKQSSYIRDFWAPCPESLDVNVGTYIYDRINKSNTKVSNSDSQVRFWLTKTLISNGSKIIDTVSKHDISDISKDSIYLTYYNPDFPWSFTYPFYWTIRTYRSDTVDQKIIKISIDTTTRIFEIYHEDPKLDLSEYIVTDNPKSKYVLYHFAAKPITDVFISKNLNNFPAAVTAGLPYVSMEGYSSGLDSFISSIVPAK